MRASTRWSPNYNSSDYVCLLIVCMCAYAEVRGQLSGVASLFPPRGSWELNSGHHTWLQASYSLIHLTLPTQGNRRLNVPSFAPWASQLWSRCCMFIGLNNHFLLLAWPWQLHFTKVHWDYVHHLLPWGAGKKRFHSLQQFFSQWSHSSELPFPGTLPVHSVGGSLLFASGPGWDFLVFTSLEP